MAANNVKILSGSYGVRRFRTEVNVKLGIQPGDAMIVAGTGTNYADIATNGMPTRGTDVFIGISRSAASNTASADGVIDIELAGPGTMYRLAATVAANINTDAKLSAILNDITNFDRTASTAAGVLTIDETNTTAQKSSTLSFVVLTGDITKGTLDVGLAGGGLINGSNI